MLDTLKRLLGGRKGAYCRLFAIDRRDAQTVLVDLARFCRADRSTGHADPHVAARLDGRREVWLRVQQHLQLDTETLWRLYDGRLNLKGDG